jgi:UDPglucose 6-dehydrogenase
MIPASEKVCVIGIWHLGSVYSACLAEAGYHVVGFDGNKETVNRLNEGVPPLFEPGLDELVKRNLDAGRLNYSSHLASALKGAKFVLITIDTPVDDRDQVDLSPVMALNDGLAKYLEKGVVVIVSSQVPVGTCGRIKADILQKNPCLDFDIVYSPENLRLGKAIEVFQHPGRIVIGADSEKTLDRAEKFFSVVDAPKVRMNLRTAEMTKHAINAFLATSISFANEIGNFCDALGADAFKVAEAMASDERIGPRLPLKPGLAFAGGTLARDLNVLKNLSTELHYPAYLINGVLDVNKAQNQVIIRKLEKIFGTVKGLQIGVLGLTYKAGTSTLRRSAAIEIIGDLVAAGASVKAFDPKASPEEVQRHIEFEFISDAYACATGSDALIILTEWPEFKGLDYKKIKSLMNRPVIIDGKNLLDGDSMVKLGYIYSGIGRGRDIKR